MKGVFSATAAFVAFACLGSLLLGGGSACTFSIPDGGSAAVDSGPPPTLGDQCQNIFATLCSAAQQCNVAIEQCIDPNDLSPCCIGTACNASSTFSSSDVTACRSAISSEGCYAISISATPSACAEFVNNQ